jgi:hypothetical protein
MEGNASCGDAKSWNICSREKEHDCVLDSSGAWMSTDVRLRLVALWSSSVARIGAAVFMIFELHILMNCMVLTTVVVCVFVCLLV